MEQRHQTHRGNDGVDNNDQSSKQASKSGGQKKKKQQRKHDSPNVSSGSSSSMPSHSLPPLPFPPEFAARCLNAATAAAAVSGGTMNMNMSSAGGASVTITKGRMFGPSPPPSGSNSNSSGDSTSKATATTTNIDLAALAQSGGISLADLGIDISAHSGATNNADSSSQPTAAPCSEAEMKALMSMFVEFMGIFSDQDNVGRSNSSGDSSPNKSSQSNPPLSRENFIRMNAAALAAASASNLQNQNNSSTFPNQSSNSKGGAQSSPFPVFSMLFGAGAGAGMVPSDISAEIAKQTGKNQSNSKNKNNGSGGNTESRSQSATKSAPQSKAAPSSGTNDEAGSEWIDYYEDDNDEDDDGAQNLSSEDIDQNHRICNDDEEDDGDGSSTEDTSHGNHGQTSKERLVRWSSKIHADIMNATDSFAKENKKASSPLRHKRAKAHPQDREFDEKSQPSSSQSMKGGRNRINKNVNATSFMMANGKYSELVKSYSGRINSTLALHKAAKMGIDWETMREMKEFGNTTLEELDRQFYGTGEGDADDNGDDDENENKVSEKENDSEQDRLLEKAEEEERAKKAAKKREKKNRKKEKAKREAALKAVQAAQKKREARITSWRSRVVTACSNGEISKLETLLGDSPFKSLEKNGIIQNIADKQDPPQKKDTIDEDESDFTGDLGSLNEYSYDDLPQHMEWLLHACFPKFNQKSSKPEKEARYKLSLYVMKMNFEVIFQPVRNGRNLFHAAAQMGDVNFVNDILEYIENNSESNSDENDLSSNLNLLCEDAGWSALHYAAAFGRTEVMEALLAGGSDLMATTEPTLTQASSNKNGITARELTESIQNGNVSSTIHCHGKALTEAMENYSNLSETSRDSGFEIIVSRLTQIEHNGYTKPEKPTTCNIPEQIESTQKDNTASKLSVSQSISSSQHSGEETKKKKRNRKKKNQQQQNSQPDAGSKNLSTNSEGQSDSTEKAEDPLVSALLSMGFTASQISAAASACGGTLNATADDLVAWIFENEEGNQEDSQTQAQSPPSNPQNEDFSSATETNNDRVTGAVSVKPSKPESESAPLQSHVTMLKVQHQQRMANLAAAQVIKEEEAAAEREREAKAAAQRLAAKREEQRRINREWNNREQVRQKEEAQAKFMEEMEKRRVIELGKAKEAQKRAQMHISQVVTASQNIHARSPHHQHAPHPTAILSSPTSSSHQPSHFQVANMHQHSMPVPSSMNSNQFEMLPPDLHQVNNGKATHPENINIRHGRGHNQSHPRNAYPNTMIGRPSATVYGNEQNSNEYNNTHPMQHGNVLPVYMDNLGYQVDSYTNAPLQRENIESQRNKKSSKNGPPPHLEVNAFDFPELGKEKATKVMKSKPNQTKTQPTSNEANSFSSSGNSARKSSKGKGRHAKQKNYSPANIKRPVSRSPPPGFQVSSNTPYTDAPSMQNAKVEEPKDINIDETPNQLGEIRATAKVFVPTFFKPPPPTVVADKDSNVASSAQATSIAGLHEQTNTTQTELVPPPFTPQPFTQSPLPSHSSPYDPTAALLAPVNSLLSSVGQPPISQDDSITGPSSSLLASVSSSLLGPNVNSLSSVPNSAPSSSPHSPIQSSASSITGGIAISAEEQMLGGSAMALDSHIGSGGSSILESIPLSASLANSSGLDNISTSNIWGGGSNTSSGLGGFSAFSANTPGFGESKKNEGNDSVGGGWGSGNALGGTGSIW